MERYVKLPDGGIAWESDLSTEREQTDSTEPWIECRECGRHGNLDYVAIRLNPTERKQVIKTTEERSQLDEPWHETQERLTDRK